MTGNNNLGAFRGENPAFKSVRFSGLGPRPEARLLIADDGTLDGGVVAELVEDNGDAVAVLRRQNMAHQRGFAGPQKP